MIGRIIAFVSCFLCAVPFIILSVYGKDSREPISFWSGDTTLKSKVKNLREYNREMAFLYRNCAIVFLLTGAAFFVGTILGVVLLCLDCTVGIYIVYRCYKKILHKYS